MAKCARQASCKVLADMTHHGPITSFRAVRTSMINNFPKKVLQDEEVGMPNVPHWFGMHEKELTQRLEFCNGF